MQAEPHMLQHKKQHCLRSWFVKQEKHGLCFFWSFCVCMDTCHLQSQSTCSTVAIQCMEVTTEPHACQSLHALEDTRSTFTMQCMDGPTQCLMQQCGKITLMALHGGYTLAAVPPHRHQNATLQWHPPRPTSTLETHVFVEANTTMEDNFAKSSHRNLQNNQHKPPKITNHKPPK